MINHIRTLLLNRDPPSDYTIPGEELVPAEFHAVPLSHSLQSVRAVLFGADPDRVMLNYRLRQLTPLLLDMEWAVYWTTKDSRIFLRDSEVFLDATTFQPVVQSLNPQASGLVLYGDPEPPDAVGRMQRILQLTVGSGGVLTVETDGRRYSLQVADEPVLPGLGQRVRIPNPQVGAQWRIEALVRPARDLGELTAALGRLGEPVMLELFGTADKEPWRTFRNLWRDHPEVPGKLAGLLLTLAYRTEESANAPL